MVDIPTSTVSTVAILLMLFLVGSTVPASASFDYLFEAPNADLSSDDYILNVFQIDCHLFDRIYWRAFDELMLEEWGIHSVSICVDWDEEYEAYVLGMIQENIVICDNTSLRFNNEDGEIRSARGLSYPNVNRGYVRWQGEENTSDTLSHEILHLILQERGYDKDVYIDMVHENAANFRFEPVRTIDADRILFTKYLVVIAKFGILDTDNS
jgi:hypothetical protein